MRITISYPSCDPPFCVTETEPGAECVAEVPDDVAAHWIALSREFWGLQEEWGRLELESRRKSSARSRVRMLEVELEAARLRLAAVEEGGEG